MADPQINIKSIEATMVVDYYLGVEDDPVVPPKATDEALDTLRQMPGVVEAKKDPQRVRVTFKYPSTDELAANFKVDASWVARFLI